MSLNTIAIVKLMSFIGTAAFTILGIMTEYKKGGKVTFWGRVAATGATISLLFSVLLLGLEQRGLAESNRQAAQQKEEANKKFDGILTRVEDNIKGTDLTLTTTGQIAGDVKKSVDVQAGVVAQTQKIANNLDTTLVEQRKILEGNRSIGTDLKRSLTPLNPLAVTFTVTYPLDAPGVREYVQRIKELAETRFKERINYDEDLKIYVVRQSAGGPIQGIAINGGSSLFPSRSAQGNAEPGYGLLNLIMLDLAFYKNSPHDEPSSNSDLRIQAVAWNPGTGISAADFLPVSSVTRHTIMLSLSIDFLENRLKQTVFTDALTRMSDEGTILSLVDLSDTVLRINLIRDQGVSPELESFGIRLGDNYSRTFDFDPTRFKQRDDGLFRRLYYRISKKDLKLPS